MDTKIRVQSKLSIQLTGRQLGLHDLIKQQAISCLNMTVAKVQSIRSGGHVHSAYMHMKGIHLDFESLMHLYELGRWLWMGCVRINTAPSRYLLQCNRIQS